MLTNFKLREMSFFSEKKKSEKVLWKGLNFSCDFGKVEFYNATKTMQ